MVTKGKNKTPFCMECSESGKNLKKEKSREKKS